MNTSYAIQLMSGPTTLAKLEVWFRAIGDNENLPEPVRSQIELILEELITNVLNHAASQSGGAVPIHIELLILDTMVELKIADAGQPFDPNSAEDPLLSDDLDERKIGGLGLFLVHQISDKLQYEYRDGWNVIYIQKKLNQEAGK